MANYGKYYIAVRLLLLKQYLEANAGRNRIVKRRELEQLLEEHGMQMLVVIADGNIRNALRSFGENEVLIHLRHRLSIVSIHCDFSAHNQTASLPQKVARRDAV